MKNGKVVDGRKRRLQNLNGGKAWRFSLKPEECFFIDDLQDNIDGAKATGMDGYCFADGDLEKLKTCLKHFYRK